MIFFYEKVVTAVWGCESTVKPNCELLASDHRSVARRALMESSDM